jgi:hypothetical protein
MAPDTNKPRRKAGRDEYEVAGSTKERGRPLRRKLLQRRFEETGEGVLPAAGSHREEFAREHGEPPRVDRAG